MGSASDWIYRGGAAKDLTFDGLATPGSDATLTMSSRGDVNDPGEFVMVNGEDNTVLGSLFEGSGGWPEISSLVIPYASLASWLSDGALNLSVYIPLGNGASQAWLQWATLSYDVGVAPSPVSQPDARVPDVSSTLMLLAGGLAGLTLLRRRLPVAA